jgi:hypothetical protein
MGGIGRNGKEFQVELKKVEKPGNQSLESCFLPIAVNFCQLFRDNFKL